MWIKDEFDRGTLVEILVAGWRVLQRDHFGVYDCRARNTNIYYVYARPSGAALMICYDRRPDIF
jgi:hypothetical protein